jgi:hypothetical protein
VTLTDSTISGNSSRFSAGIYNSNAESEGSAIVALHNSTVSGNFITGPHPSIGAGSIYSIAVDEGSVTVTLSNSTVSSNWGVGIFNDAAFGSSGSAMLAVNNSTVSGNSGGGINWAHGFNATLDIANTILNAGASGENLRNVPGAGTGTVISHGYNLSSDAAGGDGTTGPGGLLNALGDIRNTNPLLGPLQKHGGPNHDARAAVAQPGD